MWGGVVGFRGVGVWWGFVVVRFWCLWVELAI